MPGFDCLKLRELIISWEASGTSNLAFAAMSAFFSASSAAGRASVSFVFDMSLAKEPSNLSKH